MRQIWSEFPKSTVPQEGAKKNEDCILPERTLSDSHNTKKKGHNANEISAVENGQDWKEVKYWHGRSKDEEKRKGREFLRRDEDEGWWGVLWCLLSYHTGWQ